MSGMQAEAADGLEAAAREEARLQALKDLHILDTAPDERFDRVVRLAQAHFGAPVVRISFVDETRTWFKACIGMKARQAPREISICAHTIQSDKPLVVRDLKAHPTFRDSPQVTGPPGFRFYAGAPLALPDGSRVGTLCLMDYEPRTEFDDRDAAILEDFASIVVHELELHRQIAEAAVELAGAESAVSDVKAVNRRLLAMLVHELRTPASRLGDLAERLVGEIAGEASKDACTETAQEVQEVAERLVREIEQAVTISASRARMQA